MAKAWSLLTVDDSEREFRGNSGYEDVFGYYYFWDQNVQNHDKVEEGDLAVLRDKTYVLGLGWIDKIDKTTANKDRFRCPYCLSTAVKKRKSDKYTNKYKCANSKKCGKDFPKPVYDDSQKGITFYRADYSRTWQPLDVELKVSDIEKACVNHAKMNSIRELKPDVLRSILVNAQSLGETWWTDEGSGKSPDIKGGHKKASTKVRIGQQKFRQSMLARFKSACAICGPLPGAILDAAHLYEYSRKPKHDPKGGLLLRRDLHALFDREMLLIDPEDEWRVRLDPRLIEFPEIWKFEGQPLNVPQALLPNAAYLQEHAKKARTSWPAQ